MVRSIEKDLPAFTQALSEGKRITCNRKGEWRQESWGARVVRWLFGSKDQRIVNVARAFTSQLDILERTPVKTYHKAEANQKDTEKFQAYLNAAGVVQKVLGACKSKAAKQQLNNLAYRVAGLKYRIGAKLGGMDKLQENADVAELVDLATEWKKSYPLYEDKTLSEEEKAKLQKASVYPEFVKLLKNNAPLSTFFFKWALRDNCPVDAFVEFPAVTERLKQSLVSCRVGRFIDGQPERFKLLHYTPPLKKANEGPSYIEKHVELPFGIEEDGKVRVERISILDERREVKLKNDDTRTIKQILDSFAAKNDASGDLEMFGEGIRVWDMQDLRKIDLSEKNKDWYKQLPVFEKIGPEAVSKRLGLDLEEVRRSRAEGKWIAIVKASRESNTLDVDKSHGYFEVLLPTDDGKYQVLPFGKYARHWPESALKKLLFITDTVEARIEYPDQNEFFSQRQQAFAPKIIKHEDGIELMENVRKELFEARKGNIVFQFGWENCAWLWQKVMDKTFGPKRFGGPIPEYFKAPLSKARPLNPVLKRILNVSRVFSGKLQNLVVRIIEFFLLSWRGTYVVENGKRVFKSMASSPHVRKLEMYHPSMLHERIKSGEIPGRITFGNMFAFKSRGLGTA